MERGTQMIERKIDDFDCINKDYNERRAISKIKKFIDGNQCLKGKILAVSGLRRTGKTTLMEQALLSYPPEKCIYYEAQDGDTMNMVEQKLYEADDMGKEIVVIDEITKVKDFINNSASLSDIFAKDGMKIIVTGTDSLGLMLAGKNELYDRMNIVRTTYIPFAEHCEVLNTNDMDNYIAFGGLMQSEEDVKQVIEGKMLGENYYENGDNLPVVCDIESAKGFLDSAVSSNISRSIKKDAEISSRYNALKRMEKDEIQCVIEKMVEKYNGKLDVETIKDDLTSVVLTSSNGKLKETEEKHIRNAIGKNKGNITEEFIKIINADVRIKSPVGNDTVVQLEKYLTILEVLSSIETKTYTKDENKKGKWNEFVEYEHYIVQPAIKYYHLLEALKYIDNSPYYADVSMQGKENAKTFLSNVIKGEMTEQIVIFDTGKALSPNRYSVCKPKFEKIELGDNTEISVGEYDMLIWDKAQNKYWGFEVKHSSKAYLGFDEEGKYDGQNKHLINPEITECIDKYYGHRENVCVLYNGSPFVADGGEERPNTLYLNITDFMLAVDKYKDMDKVMEVLVNEKDLPLLKPNENGDIIFPSEVQACIEQVEIDL